MNADLIAAFQDAEMQCGDVAEADDEFRVAPDSGKIQFLGNPI